MRITTVLATTLPSALVFGLVVANCTGDMGTMPQDDPYENLFDQEWLVGCDPDSADCIEDYFICDVDSTGHKDCSGAPLPGGDGEIWECEPGDGTVVCQGNHFFEDDEWECVELAEGEVECTWVGYGDDGNDGVWRCEDRGEMVVCVFVDETEGPGGGDGDVDGDGDADGDGFPDDGGDSCPPGVEVPTTEVCGDNIDNDCDGEVDEDCHEEDCVCIPGAQRYCDHGTYCGWGTQTCLDDGLAWGPCEETDPPAACAAFGPIYSYTAEACCIDQGYCCQDFYDLDRDGDGWESLGSCVDIACVSE